MSALPTHTRIEKFANFIEENADIFHKFSQDGICIEVDGLWIDDVALFFSDALIRVSDAVKAGRFLQCVRILDEIAPAAIAFQRVKNDALQTV